MRNNYLPVILSLILGLSLCGCQNTSEPISSAETISPVETSEPETQDRSGNETSQSGTEVIDPEEDTFAGMPSKILSQGGPYGRISLSLPESWGYETCPVDSGKLSYGMYGIQFFPGNVDEGYIELAYVDSFGVCGTGLETEKADLAGNPVSVGTYDGHEYWDFISFQEDYEGIVAFTYSVDDWWEEYSDQVMDVLDTLSFQPSEREGGAFVYHEESEDSSIGLSFSLKNISAVGATLVFDQYDADAPTGSLEFGEDFAIETSNNGKWEEVSVVVEGNYGFHDVAYMITAGERQETELDWEWLYGELSPGEYRIKKVIHDFRGTGDFDEHIVYASFLIN